MKKSKSFPNTRFKGEVLEEALNAFDVLCHERDPKARASFIYSVDHPDADWTYDSRAEFLADYRIHNGYAGVEAWGAPISLSIRVKNRSVGVTVGAASRDDIERLFSVFERSVSASQLPAAPAEIEKPVVFIGHGRSSQWRDLKDHLVDKHGIRVEAYETGARAGHSIRDILEEMSDLASFALLVMSAEDELADGNMRARQNVVHEVGLFQGKLGFARAIVVVEAGAEVFTNLDGVQQIRYSKGNIKETFGEVLATLRREFGS